MSADDVPHLSQLHPKPGASALLDSLAHPTGGSSGTAHAGLATSSIIAAPAGQPREQAEGSARLPGSPPGARPLAAAEWQHRMEQHGPSQVEAELGTTLHEDSSVRCSHPGVDCSQLPPTHAHRLHQLGSAGADHAPVKFQVPPPPRE